MAEHKIQKNDSSPMAEAYRKVRTNLQFMNLDNNLKKVLLTSVGPSEGKSSVTGNLGLALSEAGHKVLIVDCDFRKPKQHRFFGVSNIVGAMEVLLGEELVQDVIQRTAEENLDLLTTGQKPPNPSEILGSKRFVEMINEIEADYDFILFDTPPVGMVTDAAVLSRMTDGVILVVAVGQEDVRGLERAQMQLEDIGIQILGVILNKVPMDEGGYYSYVYNHYYYGERTKSRRKKRND
ncbi:CpsD/CapB family tyrosine-protein kinase [Gottschalkiaceae bacterium SANA]|nr:CpsD/CapB family tyrosine-protein kinase [Gottschalkiaceae bacterium SANA]